jgi:hypothetical protein
MARFIDVTDYKLGAVLISVDDIEACYCEGPYMVIELSSGGRYTICESYSTLKRKLIPVEEPVHSGPGG